MALCAALTACGGGGGGGAAPSLAAASNPVIVSISGSPTALTLGQSTTITWSSSGASACVASWSGSVALAGSQVLTPTAVGNTSYTLTCDGVANSAVINVAAAPSNVPTVTLSFAPASVAAGVSTTLTWSTTNAATCVASGAWTGSRGISGSIAVTQATAGTYNYVLTCSGIGGSGSGSVVLGVTGTANNVALVVVDGGPAGANTVINSPYVNVTVCQPGTSICQTIDHVLVDTGSYGLRILASQLAPTLALPGINGASAKPAGECAQFFSGFLWGSLRRADVTLAGKTALSLPIQQVSDSDPAFSNIPASCQNVGANLGSVAALGANGILGVGLFNQDCGALCAAQAVAGTYYECTTAGCSSSAMPLANQVANPVSAFATDNNGVALVLPAVPAGGATTLTGVLIFGIDTQPNNQIGSATVYATNSVGNFTTTYKGTALTSSFLDSGSNGLFFSDATIAFCFGRIGFYCPAATLALSAVNASANGAVSGTVNFTVENFQALDPSIRAANIGGNLGRGTRNRAFDWGLPFFYGRTVFVAISGATTQHGTGPYWAY